MKEKIKQNNVYNIDCYEGLNSLKDNSIDLIYLDPPFFTQKKHSLKNKEGKEYSFEDTWKNIDDYLNFLEIRFVEMRRVLKESGSIFVHCDRVSSHNIRVILY